MEDTVYLLHRGRGVRCVLHCKEERRSTPPTSPLLLGMEHSLYFSSSPISRVGCIPPSQGWGVPYVLHRGDETRSNPPLLLVMEEAAYSSPSIGPPSWAGCRGIWHVLHREEERRSRWRIHPLLLVMDYAACSSSSWWRIQFTCSTHSASPPLLLAVEPVSHSSSSSTMIFHKMAWTISHCQQFIYKKCNIFMAPVRVRKLGWWWRISPKKIYMVAAYNPMEGIVCLSLVRPLIFWPHLISDPMVKVLWEWKHPTCPI